MKVITQVGYCHPEHREGSEWQTRFYFTVAGV